MILKHLVKYSIWIIPALLLLQCSTGDVASGTGVGNPGTTKVSIIADEGDTTAFQSRSLIRKEIPSIDKGGLLFTVTDISMNVGYFNFVTAELEGKKHTGNIPLNGPFLFNAMTGAPTPEIKDFVLPAGKYAEMRCYITNKNSTTVPYAFKVDGYFEYQSRKHEFRFKLESKELAAYKYKGPAFNISANDSTLFTLVLNADKWLRKVDIGAALDKNGISFDQDGKLLFDNTTTGKEYDKIKKSIAKSIIQSGYLLITSLD